MRRQPSSWTTLFAKLGFARRTRRLISGSRFHRKLRVEQCEDRRMLAPFLVTNTGDGFVNSPGDQPGTLRQAVFDAQLSLEADDTITFDPAVFNTPKTILLTQGELFISQSLTIDGTVDGTGPSQVSLGITIQAYDPTPFDVDHRGDGSRIFNISPSAENTLVEFNSLTLTGGGLFARFALAA
jgi:hypothetical protein